MYKVFKNNHNRFSKQDQRKLAVDKYLSKNLKFLSHKVKSNKYSNLAILRKKSNRTSLYKINLINYLHKHSRYLYSSKQVKTVKSFLKQILN